MYFFKFLKIKGILCTILEIAMLLSLCYAEPSENAPWRSILYPEDWKPDFTCNDETYGEMFLHDFSYAGYHTGLKPIPVSPPGETYDVTAPPYNADNTGTTETSAAIQKAIDDAAAAGGGVVYLPAGTYRVRPSENAAEVLRISSSNIVIKGAGKDKTKIYNDEPNMRLTTIVGIYPDGIATWADLPEENVTKITSDLKERTTVIPVASTEGYNVGDWVMLDMDITNAFLAEHFETKKWSTDMMGTMFYRQITDIDRVRKTLTIDIPLRYWLKTRDNARVYKTLPHLSEVGIQDLSFGMIENTAPGKYNAETGYNTEEGALVYVTHASSLINARHSVNGWIKNVASYKPDTNTKYDIHMLSNAVMLESVRGITVEDCRFSNPLNEGAGGNGYMITLRGQECLIRNCYTSGSRHNYSFGRLVSSGNVITSCSSVGGAKESDFHMQMSPANLYDNMYVSGNQLESINRDEYGSTSRHGHTTTQSVFWNTYGEKYQSGESSIVETQQFGIGYVIGTRGPANAVKAFTGDNTAPLDFVEGQGMSDTLEPQSLYTDQLQKRIERESLPDIKRTIPRNNAKHYYKDPVYITFDREMDKSTITAENLIISPEIPYTVSYDEGAHTAVLSFPQGLAAETTYTVAAERDKIKSANQGSLISDAIILTFTACTETCHSDNMDITVTADNGQSSAKVTNYTTIAQYPMLITALYKDDKLIDMASTTQEAEPGASIQLTTPAVDVPDGLTEYDFKAFLWNNDDGKSRPIGKPVSKSGDDLSTLFVSPAADAFVRRGDYAKDNYGAEPTLFIKYAKSIASNRRYGFIQFDLKDYKPGIKRALLQLYGYTTGTKAATMNLYPVTDGAWEKSIQEDSICFSGSPAETGNYGGQLASFALQPGGNQIEIDLTDLITEKMNGTRLMTLYISPATSATDNNYIHAKENEVNPPMLILEY